MTAKIEVPDAMKRLNIIIPLEMKKELKTLAVETDSSMTNIVISAISDVISKSKKNG